jgi:Response receiver domain
VTHEAEWARRQRAAALRFLQTALIVDDAATLEPQTVTTVVEPLVRPGVPPTEVSTSATATDVGHDESADAPASTVVEIPITAEGGVDVKTLSDTFSSRGIACAVLRPAPGEDVGDRVVSVGSRVDIVILDWQLDRELGTTALELVNRLLARESGRHKLIAIYTNELNLAAIVTELEKIDGVTPTDDENTLVCSGTRIKLVRKPSGSSSGVNAAELPDVLIAAFAEVNAGLVPTVTLNAIAATRENTFRLLGRVGTDLDIGYAGHILRVEHIEEAAEHLVDSIADEFRAIIQDDKETVEASALPGFEEWLAQREADCVLRVGRDVLSELIGVNVGDRKDWDPFLKAHPEIKALKEERLSEALGPEDASATRASDAEFAMLMSLRHSYLEAGHTLQLGTIVRERSGEQRYWLCVQPVCDSVRLKQATIFPFLRLEAWSHSDLGKKFDFVADGNRDAKYIHLWVGDHPRDLHLLELDPSESGTVLFTARDESAPPLLTCHGGTELEWIGELKPAHSQRVVAELSSWFGRVGLSESEWLRFRSKEGQKPPDTRTSAGVPDAGEG